MAKRDPDAPGDAEISLHVAYFKGPEAHHARTFEEAQEKARRWAAKHYDWVPNGFVGEVHLSKGAVILTQICFSKVVKEAGTDVLFASSAGREKMRKFQNHPAVEIWYFDLRTDAL